MSLRSLAESRSVQQLEPEALSASLARADLRSAALPPLVVQRGWPLAKIPLLLRCCEPAAHPQHHRWWSFYLLGPGRIPFSCRSAMKNRTAVYLDDLHAVVQAFPADTQLSGVDRAVGKKTAMEVVGSALQEGGRGWRSVTTQVLNYKPSRRLTVRYRLSPATGNGRTVFGKLYPAGGDQVTLQAQQALLEAMTRQDRDRFSTAQIVGRVSSWNALLWRRAPGRSVFELLGSDDLGQTVRRVARCLGSLHGSDTQWYRIHDRQRELSTVRSWVDAACFADSIWRVELEGAYLCLRQEMVRAASTSLVASHRDFYDKQILISEGRCTLLDLEVASRAEPELDVANFLAHLVLRSLQGRSEAVESTAHIFVEEYSRLGLRLDSARLEWYLASSLLRLACVYSFRAEWMELVPILVQASNEAREGQQILTGDSL